MVKITQLFSAIGLAALAASTMAQDNPRSYWGLNVGQSQSQLDNRSTTNSLVGPTDGFNTFSSDDHATAYKLFGGYQFNRNFALEGGYFNLGKFNYSTTLPSGPLYGQYQIEGVNVDAVGLFPLNDRWSASARVGVQYAITRDDFSGPGMPATASRDNSQRGTNLKLGLGLQYEISPTMQIRGEAERYRLRDGVGNSGDVNVLSVSLIFPIGHTATR